MSETKIALDSDVTGVVLTRENEWTENVNGVKYGNTKVWGRPLNFKWDYSTYLETSNSTLSIPAEDFLYVSSDKLLTFTDLSSSSTSTAYMPHKLFTISRDTDTTIYYGDYINVTPAQTWTKDLLDTCLRSCKISTSTGEDFSNPVYNDTTVLTRWVVYDDTSFIRCFISDYNRKYFDSLQITYVGYKGETKTKTLCPSTTSSSTPAPYIASKKGTSAVASWWYCGSSGSSTYMLGVYFNEYVSMPLWSKVYLTQSFPSSELVVGTISNPTFVTYATTSQPVMLSIPTTLSNIWVSSQSATCSWSTSSTSYVNSITFSVTLRWSNFYVSNYSYYAVRVISARLLGTDNSNKYNPLNVTNQTDALRCAISSSLAASRMSVSGSNTFSFTTGGQSSSSVGSHYILWNVEILGSINNYDWESLGIYGSPTYNNWSI